MTYEQNSEPHKFFHTAIIILAIGFIITMKFVLVTF